MKGIFKSLEEDIIGANSPAYEITIVEDDTGEEFSKKFFQNNQPLRIAAKKFNEGDPIELVLDKTKFKNLKDIRSPKAGDTVSKTATPAAAAPDKAVALECATRLIAATIASGAELDLTTENLFTITTALADRFSGYLK